MLFSRIEAGPIFSTGKSNPQMEYFRGGAFSLKPSRLLLGRFWHNPILCLLGILVECFRGLKSRNFPVGRLLRAKTFRTKCVNCFRDIYMPKVRKSLSRHTCQSAKTILTKDMNVATILQTIKYLPERFPDCSETFQTIWKLSTFVYSSIQLMLRLHFMSIFVNTRKNFPDTQKLSCRQCRRADEVFGTLLVCLVGSLLQIDVVKCKQFSFLQHCCYNCN